MFKTNQIVWAVNFIQGAGGGVASGPVVPEEHPGGEVVAGGGSCVRQGEHGRRALPAQGGPQHVQDLPGPLQGPREDVQLLHHRYACFFSTYL